MPAEATLKSLGRKAAEEAAQGRLISAIRNAQRMGVPVHGVLFVGDQEPIYPGTCRDNVDREAHP